MMLKRTGLMLGPVFFILMLIISPASDPAVNKVFAVALWMITWWVTEAVDLSVTALLPMILLPLLEVTTLNEATSQYSNPIIYLFMGGFVIAIAMEKWNLHKRIALFIISKTGTGANGIIFGFMLATNLLSMWISNTATTVMMLPIAISVVQLLFEDHTFTRKERRFALSLMLGIAFSANVGGIATLIGTPPNVVFAGFIRQEYGLEIGFLQWMLMGVPLSILFLLIIYILLTRVFYPSQLHEVASSGKLIEQELKKLGKLTANEKKVLLVFTVTAVLWISRQFLQQLFPSILLHDTIIAMAGAVTLFLIPSDRKGEAILLWQDMHRLPWGILILFGGGLTLAKAMEKVGIIDIIAGQAAGIGSIGNWLIILSLSAVVLFLTEVMSNVALITVFLPVLGGIAIGLGVDPLLICIPATIASSCAFMLPMSTPPNAIVYASGHIKVYQMMRIGVVLNVLILIILTAVIQWVIPLLF